MALNPLRIPDLQGRNPIVDDQRRPVASFINSLNRAFRQIVTTVNDQSEIINRLNAAEAELEVQAATIADQAAIIADLQSESEASASETSLVNSGVINEAGPLQATAAGTIIIADHQRKYGNPTLNPTVSVTGDNPLTSFVTDDQVYVFYDDPARAGGAVTYQFSLDVADAVQGGTRHSVGSVVIPAAGSQSGFYVRPPGGA